MESDSGPTMTLIYQGNGMIHEPPDFEVTLLEPRPFRPFKSSEEYLYAMKEDLAEWLNGLYEGLYLDADNFLEQMETGVILCQHANNVVRKAREYYRSCGGIPSDGRGVPDRDVVYRRDVVPETFPARDNVSNFISWCRSLRIKECLLFETDDLVLRKNERSFILCLLEVARKGVKYGMPAPVLVQLEQEIDAEIANDGYETFYGPHRQIVTNDLRSLHERVVELLSRCTCPSQFPMIRVADGKYRIGDTKVLIFVRILRTHVMVRVGGGWDTLEHYLDKHDPCRCRSGHRLATSAKLTMFTGKSSIPSMHVTYNRPAQPNLSNPGSPQNTRRSLPYVSPTPSRRSRNISPPAQVRQVPQPCSDDSSTSSLQDTLERQHKDIHRKMSRDFSSDEEGFEEDHRRSRIRKMANTRDTVLKDSFPSSWKYSSSIPKKDVQQSVISNGHYQRRSADGHSASKLPALTPRSERKQPPIVGKVSPRLHYPQNLHEQRSQSSEDLFQAPASGPAQPQSLIFHSRGSSPVNMKTQSTISPTNGFRRNDPKRHSSPRMNQRSDLKMRLSPPKFIPAIRPLNTTPNCRNNNLNGVHRPTRRMFWSPERPRTQQKMIITRKNSAPTTPEQQFLPVFEKLLENSDLCSDKNFVMKIEQLIAEFQAKTKMDDSGDYGYQSLPANFGVETKSLNTYSRKSPVENCVNKTPSKIPLPTWYPKCPS